MPTRPSPNSPYMAARLEAALGVNAPGTPSSVGKPGLQSANLSFPRPPMPAQPAPPGTLPPGNPGAGARPTPQPQPPGQPAPTPRPPGGQGLTPPPTTPPAARPQPPRPPQPGQQPPAARPPVRPPQPGQPAPAPRPPVRPPQPGQPAAFGGPGATDGVVSPLGTATVNPDGSASMALSPEGDMRYRAAVLAGREALGPLPRIFRNPGLPQMPYELGRWNYNPFTGAFRKG